MCIIWAKLVSYPSRREHEHSCWRVKGKMKNISSEKRREVSGKGKIRTGQGVSVGSRCHSRSPWWDAPVLTPLPTFLQSPRWIILSVCIRVQLGRKCCHGWVKLMGPWGEWRPLPTAVTHFNADHNSWLLADWHVPTEPFVRRTLQQLEMMTRRRLKLTEVVSAHLFERGLWDLAMAQTVGVFMLA